jgi:hypothetical protein
MKGILVFAGYGMRIFSIRPYYPNLGLGVR